MRSESDPQVIPGAITEVDFVTNIEPYAEDPGVKLDSATRIQHTGHVMQAEVVHRAGERSKRGGLVVKTEIDETAFDGDKVADRTASRLEL